MREPRQVVFGMLRIICDGIATCWAPRVKNRDCALLYYLLGISGGFLHHVEAMDVPRGEDLMPLSGLLHGYSLF